MANQLIVNPTKSALTGLDTQATLDTDGTQGANAALVFTAVPSGVLGNLIKVAQTVPTDDNAAHALAVSVDTMNEGVVKTITIQLAVDTDGSTITSTGDDIKAAVAAHSDASQLVTVADKAANDGSGLASVFAAAALTGGLKLDIPKESAAILDITAAQAITLCDSGAVIMDDAVSYSARRQAARILRYSRILND